MPDIIIILIRPKRAKIIIANTKTDTATTVSVKSALLKDVVAVLTASQEECAQVDALLQKVLLNLFTKFDIRFPPMKRYYYNII